MFRARTIKDKTLQAAISGSGDIVSFESAFEKPLSELILNIEPIQSGEGDPSPTNIRPISGWTGANVARTGKNLFDEEYPTISSSMKYRAIYVGNGTFTMSTTLPLNSGSANLFFLAGDVSSGASTSTNGVSLNVPRTITSIDGYVTVAYRIVNNDNQYNPVNYNTQIELGSTATAYEPYNGNTYPITWSDTAGTVYGGTLDVMRGKLIANMQFFTLLGTTGTQFDGTRMVKGGNTARNEFYTLASQSGLYPTTLTNVNDLLCSHFKTMLRASSTERMCYMGGAQFRIILPLDDPLGLDTADKMNAWLAEQYANGTPVQYCVRLLQPIEYDLDPVTIQTLLGQNNLWADTGDIAQLAVGPITGKLKFKLIQ